MNNKIQTGRRFSFEDGLELIIEEAFNLPLDEEDYKRAELWSKYFSGPIQLTADPLVGKENIYALYLQDEDESLFACHVMPGTELWQACKLQSFFIEDFTSQVCEFVAEDFNEQQLVSGFILWAQKYFNVYLEKESISVTKLKAGTKS